MSALLPCKCGREPTILRRTPMVGGLFRAIASRVECTPCEESTQAWHDTEELAIAAWNRRTPTSSVDWAVEGPRLLDASREIAAIHLIGLNAATGTLGWGAPPRAAAIARATPGGET